MSYQKLNNTIENVYQPQDWLNVASIMRKTPTNQLTQSQVNNIYLNLISAAGTSWMPKDKMNYVRSTIYNFVKATKSKAKPTEIAILRQTLQKQNSLQRNDQYQSKNDKPENQQKNVAQKIIPHNQLIKKSSSMTPSYEIVVKKSVPAKIGHLQNSLGMLESYSKQHMKRGFSSTTFQPGSHYLGVRQSRQYGQSVLVPHQQISRLPPKTPDIQTNFKWYAGNTINKWNDFVMAQAKFSGFVNSINSPQKVQKYYVDQIAKSTKLTWQAQVIATCVYYYFHLPMIKLLSSGIEMKGGFTADQMQNYEIGLKNPLGISNKTGLQLVMLIMNNPSNGDVNPITYIARSISDLLIKENYQGNGPQAAQNTQYLLNYVIERTGIVRQYYTQQGIDPEMIQRSILNPIAYDIKFMANPLPTLEQNQFLKAKILQVLDQEKSLNPEKEMKTWNFAWNSQRYPCYDYLFN